MAEGVRSDEEFSGTKPVEERHRVDEARLDGWMRRACRGLPGAADRAAIQGRPVQPDLSARYARPLLCDAPQAVRQTAAVGACGRPRIQGHRRAQQTGFSGRQGLCAVHRRRGDRRGVLHHVDGRGPGVLGPDPAEPDAGGAPRDLLQQDRDAGEAAHLRPAGDRAWRFRQARQLFRASGRSLDQAVPRFRNRAHPRGREADRMAAADRAGADSGSRSCTATIASTT